MPFVALRSSWAQGRVLRLLPMRHTLLMHDIPQGIGIGGIYRPRHQQAKQRQHGTARKIFTVME
jgi:hypothetical protein